jgi:steroid delta-isomerase-like uncharacterized protein
MSDANKELARRYVEEVFNGNLDAIEDIVHPNFVNHHGSPPPGPGPFRERVERLRLAFPDIEYRVLDAISEGDKVALRVEASGTQLGEFRGVPPSGKHAIWAGMEFFRIEDGKVIEHWASHDELGRYQQIGALPNDFVGH